MSKNHLFNPIRDELIATCLVREDYQQASGAASNNKLVIERLQTDGALARKVVDSLAYLAMRHNPDLILPVPDGANWLAEAVSLETGVDFGLLYKADDGSVDCLPDTQERLSDASSVVILDDVLNRLTSTRKVLAVAGVLERTRAVIGVFDRGPVDRAELDIPIETIVRSPIPEQLADDDKRWRLTQSA